MIVELTGNDRMEKVHLKKVRCQAKVVGTLVTVAGAMLMTLHKGPIMDMARTKHAHPPHSNAAGDDSTDEDWLKGCIFLIIATLAWASLFILQWVEELMEQDEAETEKAKASPVAENSMKAKKEES
ncbi:hypothetical protein BHE74_00047680 [Ensete ventricosum]|nr:hypothetical protein BHE74_00047680 [Ensete ventricosum]